MFETGTTAQLELVAWMYLADPTMTMSEAVAELKAAGNTILEVDVAGRRIKVADMKVEV